MKPCVCTQTMREKTPEPQLDTRTQGGPGMRTMAYMRPRSSTAPARTTPNAQLRTKPKEDETKPISRLWGRSGRNDFSKHPI